MSIASYCLMAVTLVFILVMCRVHMNEMRKLNKSWDDMERREQSLKVSKFEEGHSTCSACLADNVYCNSIIERYQFKSIDRLCEKCNSIVSKKAGIDYYGVKTPRQELKVIIAILNIRLKALEKCVLPFGVNG